MLSYINPESNGCLLTNLSFLGPQKTVETKKQKTEIGNGDSKEAEVEA